MKLRFRFDLGKLKANNVRFASVIMGPEKFHYNYMYYKKDSVHHGGLENKSLSSFHKLLRKVEPASGRGGGGDVATREK